ncbi:hypothetical protein ACFL0O_01280 [Thermodesulfobacteriota bacterium]
MEIIDYGGRREGIDRRQDSQPLDFPERRSDEDRRIGTDRRSGQDRRSIKGFRAIVGIDRRKRFNKRRPL